MLTSEDISTAQCVVVFAMSGVFLHILLIVVIHLFYVQKMKILTYCSFNIHMSNITSFSLLTVFASVT